LLKENKYLVHDFDGCHLTALHWAARRNNHEMISVLLENGHANVNAHDLAGRTSLYHASKLGKLEAVRILLANKAHPSYHYYGRYTPLDVSATPLIYKLIAKSKLLFILLNMIPSTRREAIWKEEGVNYFLTELADN
jgi:ankyrin repeat protein